MDSSDGDCYMKLEDGEFAVLKSRVVRVYHTIALFVVRNQYSSHQRYNFLTMYGV